MTQRSLLSNPPMVYKKSHGFDYPQFFEYFAKAEGSTWRGKEVSMKSDVKDWETGVTQEERNLIAGILKGFTSAEMGISCYWGDTVCKMFPKPEIQAMARMFSAFEQIHASAYNYLSDTLGLNEFEEFISDPTAQKKVERFFTDCKSSKASLAVFSGAGEGVSLYSSFAILLAFSRKGKFKGLAQIISWSCLDESQHSDAGSDLFKELVKEVGIEQEEIEFDHSHISGGISKINTADNVFGIFTSRAMKERGKYQIQCMKSRSSTGVGQKIDLEYNIETMRITDEGGEEGGYNRPQSSIMDSIKAKSKINAEAGGTSERPTGTHAWDKPMAVSGESSKVSGEVQSAKLKQLLGKIKSG